VPHLEPGDIIIDGGNSHYPDTNRRCRDLEAKGFLYVGCGVSGGEEGARYGPSLMPGGSDAAWPHLKPIFQSIAAKADGEPCCDWVGQAGSGHFVKMVHNGIEYGDMQLIGEAYHLLRDCVRINSTDMADVFTEWNKGELDSFLIEITADILRFRDADGTVLLDKIRDAAGQKGTGKWTAQAALDMGIPVTLIGEAVFARCLSALKSERVEASHILVGPDAAAAAVKRSDTERDALIKQIGEALYAAKIISYTQGFMLMREMAKEQKWRLNYGGIAMMWKGGCIIRSRFLGNIRDAFRANPELKSLLFADFFKQTLARAHNPLRHIVANAALVGIPVPALSAALAFYDGYRAEKLPANLIQAQRDYFGAHTYELLGKEGTFVHTNWTGRGGDVASSTYNA